MRKNHALHLVSVLEGLDSGDLEEGEEIQTPRSHPLLLFLLLLILLLIPVLLLLIPGLGPLRLPVLDDVLEVRAVDVLQNVEPLVEGDVLCRIQGFGSASISCGTGSRVRNICGSGSRV